MVSQRLFDILSNLTGINKQNVFVYVGNDPTLRCLNGTIGNVVEHKVSMEAETLQVEVPNDFLTNRIVQMSRTVLYEVLSFYKANAIIKTVGNGRCTHYSECDIFLEWSSDLKASTSTLPIGTSHYEVHMRKPEPVYSPLYFFEKSFGLGWLSVVIASAVFSLIMWAMVKLLVRYRPQTRPVTLADAVSDNISAFSGHGFTIDIKSAAYRTLVVVALLWNMMMSISFSTNLVSYFCAQNVPSVQYTGLIDLLDTGDYSICVLNIHSELYQILKETDEVYEKYKMFLEPSICNEIPNLNHLICSEKVAYLTDSLFINDYNKKFPTPRDCKRIVLPQVYEKSQHGIILKPHMKFREQFNHVILRLHEVGNMKKIQEGFIYGPNVKMDPEPTAVQQMQAGYIVVGYFIALGLCYVILLVEIGVKWICT